MFKIFKKHQPLLGLEINDNTVSLVELDKHKQIKVYATSSAPKLEVALQQVLWQAKTNTKNVAIAMPHSAVIFKTIELDAGLNDYEVETYIFGNCQKLIGLPLNKIKLDYKIVEKNKGQKNKIELFATRTEWLEEKILLLKSANLNPVAVDIDSYALLRAVKQHEPLIGVTAIANASTNKVIFLVVNNQQIIFYKEGAKLDECLEFYKTTNNPLIQRLLLLGNSTNEELKESLQKPAEYPCAMLNANGKWSWLSYGLAWRSFADD